MKSHGPRKVACDGKTKYSTEKRAVLSARRLTMKENDVFDVYQCRHCGGWHIGHTLPRGLRESMRRFNEEATASSDPERAADSS